MGHYSIEGNPFCTPCPAGFMCPNSTNNEILPCSNGTYTSGAASECRACPAGWQCPYTDGHGNSPCVQVS